MLGRRNVHRENRTRLTLQLAADELRAVAQRGERGRGRETCHGVPVHVEPGTVRVVIARRAGGRRSMVTRVLSGLQMQRQVGVGFRIPRKRTSMKDPKAWDFKVYQFPDNDQFSNLESLVIQMDPQMCYVSLGTSDGKGPVLLANRASATALTIDAPPQAMRAKSPTFLKTTVWRWLNVAGRRSNRPTWSRTSSGSWANLHLRPTRTR